MITFLAACQKSDEVEVVELDSHTHFDLTTVDNDSEYIVAGGGEIWNMGILIHGMPQDLSYDSLTNKQVTQVKFLNSTKLGAVANDGQYHTYNESWTSYSVTSDLILRSFDVSDDRIIIGGGKSFAHGYIRTFDNHGLMLFEHKWNHQINKILHISESKWIAVGYGIVLISDDSGEHWTWMTDVKGDSYSDAIFINEQTGWICGHEGSILSTHDGGLSWKSEIKGGGVFNSGKHFNALAAHKEEFVVVGDSGDIRKRTESGSWQKMNTNISNNLYDAAYFRNGQWIVVGENGFMALITL